MGTALASDPDDQRRCRRDLDLDEQQVSVTGEPWSSSTPSAHAETVSVHRIDERVEATAWDWLHRHDERPYSFVDATSFALMRSLGISEALAFDGDFAAAGFTELRA